MRRARCIAFGCRIRTDIALPGAIPDDDREPPEIVIHQSAACPPAAATAPTLWRDGVMLYFAPRGVAQYRITASTISVAPCHGADEEEIADLLIATALPGLLWIAGAVVLHAAAVILPGHDHAVAIAAPSGTGKSTMLAQLVARGGRILADDSVCLRIDAAGIVASGLPGGYFAREATSPGRRFVAVAGHQAQTHASLGAILILSRHPGEMPATLCRLAPVGALAAILSNRHRSAIPALFGNTARTLADVARVAQSPTFSWSRPDGSPRLTAAEWHAIIRSNGR